MYDEARGVEKDPKRAFEWYLRAAELGHAYSQNYVGVAYKEGLVVRRDYRKAFSYISKAAEQGEAHAQRNLGRMYIFGQGIEKNLYIAGQWYKKAADNGLEEAKAYLKESTKKCSEHVRPSDGSIIFNMADCWFVAPTNDPMALHAVGVAYLSGTGGVEQAPEKAYPWMLKAAKAGSGGAQIHLAIMYAEGNGVARDPVESYAWTLVVKDDESLNELQRKVVEVDIRHAKRNLSFLEERKAKKKAKQYKEEIHKK
ncbi:MAG: sel1 repeat family protein [Rhodospirillales bacterium]|nr:sel1 repeat family protein [Rhodospirillales bacterium]MCB9997075.1 sel1 repeat family protein [Rhodospirillales bacterium]